MHLLCQTISNDENERSLTASVLFTMAEQYCRSLLRVSLAQICQSLGWHATQSTPLDLLTDVLERYIFEIAKCTHRYSEQTDPNLDDLGLAFRHLGVQLNELQDFVQQVDPVPFAHETVSFPAPKKCNLRFPNPNSREIQNRDEHIPEYLPLMHPTPEDEMEGPASPSADIPESTPQIVDVTSSNSLQVPVDVNASTITGEKRLLNSPQDRPVVKRPRLSGGNLPEEAGHSQYEMKSVIMTQKGELTPTKGKEGKLPDACTPPQGYKSIIKEQKVPSPKQSFLEQKQENKEKSIEDSVREVLKKIQSENKKLIEKGDELLSAKFKKKLEKQPKIPSRPKGRPPKQNKTLGPIKIDSSQEKPVEIIVYPPSLAETPGDNNAAASTSFFVDKDKVSVKEEPVDYSDNSLRSPLFDENSQGASPRLVIAETCDQETRTPTDKS
ncbi:hypothetical protein KUTeg_020658 [Tegillarca granosa]|uniref:Bromodomain associated domain-containing protein n=1 Tax=Tegillarca granosa TaxID=220873 RepID=A0ABQ9E8J2_TEGGR|nr:hypothetical protein KUTeg_020658 [Tegillarca granosa]